MAKSAAVVASKAQQAETTALEVAGLEDLKRRFAEARSSFDQQTTVWEAAQKARLIARVEMARAAWLTATHPQVLTPRTRKAGVNGAGAAAALGMPQPTLYPYLKAGEALNRKDRAGLLSAPNAEDIELVSKAIDRAVNEKKRESVARKQQQAQVNASKAEAHDAQQAQQQQAQDGPQDGPQAQQVPAQQQQAGQAAAGPQQAQDGPQQVPAQDGPSLADEYLATCRKLAQQAKVLKQDKQAWQAAQNEALAILSDVFPALKR